MRRYQLSKKGLDHSLGCPVCGSHLVQPYIDLNTGTTLNDVVGKCHGKLCDYHLTPSQYFNRYPLLEMVVDPPIVREPDDVRRDEPDLWDLKTRRRLWRERRRGAQKEFSGRRGHRNYK